MTRTGSRHRLALACALVLLQPRAQAESGLYAGFALDPLFWLDMALGSEQSSCPNNGPSNTSCSAGETASGAIKLNLGWRFDRQLAIEAAGLRRKENNGPHSRSWTDATYLSGVYSLHAGGLAFDLRGGMMEWSTDVDQPSGRRHDSRRVPYAGAGLHTDSRGLNLKIDLDWLKQAREPIDGHGNPHAWQLSFGLSGQFN